MGFVFNEPLRGMSYFSKSPYCMHYFFFPQEMSSTTLSQFLLENEGKRCVVVIDVRSQHLVVLSKEVLTMN
jgi:hypothetical protein